MKPQHNMVVPHDLYLHDLSLNLLQWVSLGVLLWGIFIDEMVADFDFIWLGGNFLGIFSVFVLCRCFFMRGH